MFPQVPPFGEESEVVNATNYTLQLARVKDAGATETCVPVDISVPSGQENHQGFVRKAGCMGWEVWWKWGVQEPKGVIGHRKLIMTAGVWVEGEVAILGYVKDRSGNGLGIQQITGGNRVVNEHRTYTSVAVEECAWYGILGLKSQVVVVHDGVEDRFAHDGLVDGLASRS